MNNTQFPLTRRLTAIWIAAVIVFGVGTIGATSIQRRAEVQRLEAIRADIRQIDSATAQIAFR